MVPGEVAVQDSAVLRWNVAAPCLSSRPTSKGRQECSVIRIVNAALILTAVVGLALVWCNRAAHPPIWWYAGFVLIGIIVLFVPLHNLLAGEDHAGTRQRPSSQMGRPA